MTHYAADAADSGSLEAQIARLSGGNVTRITPHGPLFAHPPHRLRVDRSTLVPALATRDRITIALLTVGWAVGFVAFWQWWLAPGHRGSWTGLILTSVLLLYLTAQAGYFLVAIGRLSRVSPRTALPRMRVAMATTRAPAEPWSTARATLEAMRAQDFPYGYDVWLCDEDPAPEIEQWCREHGVCVSTRRGVPEYHRDTWPRRTKCKEGNLAYFYDHWGYAYYDVVVQLDCDHRPSRGYLAEMVRPFADKAVGYVAAPSICDANAAESWSARGRLHREAPFHGAFQLGHVDRLAPVCIGSHYSVRTKALREIGGLGPDLAEDFTTTFLFNSAGWHGAFAIDAEAHGLGPATFADMVTQEYQWSRSLTATLFQLVPCHMTRLGLRLRLRFTIPAVYYVLLASGTAAGLALTAVAAATGKAWMNVNYLAFFGHMWAMTICLLLLILLLRRRGLLRPRSAPVVSWEQWLFILARWPFVAWGVLGAVVQEIRGRPVHFKVTPKDRTGLEPLPHQLLLPFTGIAIGLSAAALAGEQTGPAVGYVLLCILGAAVYAMVAVLIAILHVREAARTAGTSLRGALATARTPLLVAALPLLPVVSAITLYPAYAVAVLRW